MNNRFPIVSMLGFVFCLGLSVYLATNVLAPKRVAMYTGAEAQLKRVYVPMAAFDKFYADAQWVAAVQEMGGSNNKKDSKKLSDEEEKAQRQAEAKRLYSRIDRLSDLDPNNKNLYEIGAMFISNDCPDEAIALLNKGNSLMKDPSYKFPFNEYHIINNVKCANDEAKKKESRGKMIELLKVAMDRPGAPEYVQNQWLRLCAEEKGYDDNSTGRLKLWRDYYVSKVHAQAQYQGGAPVGPDGKPIEKPAGEKTGEEATYTAGDSYASTERGSALLAQVMRMAQTMAVDNFKKRQETKDAAALEKLKKEHAEISQAFFSVAPTGHYSKESLHPYDAGDLFDVYTGTPVTPYGVDPDMLQEGRIVIYKGDYSQVTGKARSEDYSKFNHAEFLKKVNAAK